MSEKRKHVTLTLDKKYEILKRLDKGDKILQLSKEYNVGRATIHDIRLKREKIESFYKSGESSASVRKTLKLGEFPQVEDALYAWFMQERSRHTPISGDILMEKAKYFYKKIMKKDDFRASVGWFDKFKRRFGIRLLTQTGEKLSSDEASVQPFIDKFKQTIEEMDLCPDQVYNADESGLFWRLLPKKTFVHRDEASAPGRKLAKDRLTFMPCSNASGTHKLQMLVVGKSKNPRPFKNVNLPVLYANQTKGWMTKTLFSEWFHSNFVPSVKKFLKEQNLSQKALLILDNCPGHPDEEELKDGEIRALFLPPNVTPLLQPMDQNVIQTIKTNYKKTLLYSVLSKEGSVLHALKNTNIKDVVFNLASAWEKVSNKTIVCSWKKLWPTMNLFEAYVANEKEDSTGQLIELNELREAIVDQLVDDPNDITTADIDAWLVGDNDEQWQFMTDDEIVEEIIDSAEANEATESTTVATNPQTVNTDKALDAFTTAITWAEENGASATEILTLKGLQEKVLKVSFSAKKQKTIKHFFSATN